MTIDKPKTVLFLEDEVATINWAREFSSQLCAPLVIYLSGDIGAGKTTLVRAMLRSLGIEHAIKSPTFSLVESYSCAAFLIHHFDLYRIHNEEELEYIGFRDFFSKQAICCVEWPEQAPSVLPTPDVHLKLAEKEFGRQLEIKVLTEAGQKVLK